MGARDDDTHSLTRLLITYPQRAQNSWHLDLRPIPHCGAYSVPQALQLDQEAEPPAEKLSVTSL